MNNPLELIFGLDIGIASVGWAVITPNRIVNLGVRAFDKAETDKLGESLNLKRRSARLMRHRLFNRQWRLTKLSRLLKKQGLINQVNFFKNQPTFKESSWQLRVEGLNRLLTPEEWARVTYHVCKHRGFHWISKAERAKAENDAKGEGGKVKQGLAKTNQLMKEKNYRTAAEMVLGEFPGAQRNKQGEYTKALSRELLAQELKKLFDAQRGFGNSQASTAMESAILGNGDRKSGFLWLQKPALSGLNLLKMLGHCTFEPTEYRAPKASFSAERHVWLTKLNNLRVIEIGNLRPLTKSEHAAAINLPYQQASDFTYKQLRAAFVENGLWVRGDNGLRFSGLTYGIEKDGIVKDPESEKLIKLPSWQEIKKTLTGNGLSSEWLQISTTALEGTPKWLDDIAWVLSIYKEEDEAAIELRKLSLPGQEKTVQALLDLSFDKFHSLSLKALRVIVPLMESGLRYDEAVAKTEYKHHSVLNKGIDLKQKFLPPFYIGRDLKTGRMEFKEDLDVPRNPVVIRAINQARKVVNALVKTYGAPHEVHIEMARDLSRSFDERRQIKKDQDEFKTRNENEKHGFKEAFSCEPSGVEFEKWRLYKEQGGKCAYSLEPIDLNRLLEKGYVEIDHALPESRSFDNSRNNKVIVLAHENRNKGNATPYEYLDGANSSERWRRFVAFVEGNKSYRMAKRTRLLRKNFGEEEAKSFRDRNLNDTRYICKFFKNYVETYLQLAADSQSQRCVVVSGQLTSFLRARWGLVKVREDSDRHHAMDAVVVAACTHSMVARLTSYNKYKELSKAREGFVDVETGEIVNPKMFEQLEKHFPTPWDNFRHELTVRLQEDDAGKLRETLACLGTYPPEALSIVKPLFVSRAPQRRNSGAAHKDTIYGQPERLKIEGSVTQKVALKNLNLKDLDNLVDAHRNEKLYAAIRQRLEAYVANGGKFSNGESKAFPADQPLCKPDRQGNLTGPIVRSVKLQINKLTGIPVRGGIAKNDTMLRVDVFTRAGRFHLVPVYVHHKVKELPNMAIVAFKDESEWTLIDESFVFMFSLYPNDLVKVQQKGKQPVFGYFASCHRGTAAINIWAQDRKKSVGKDGQMEGIGVKTALSLEKFQVDVLGNVYPAPPEVRSGLA
jgi:CRISPR-associated endonuclease Csn1